MRYKNLSVLLVVAISIAGYNSFAQLGLATTAIRSGHPTIFDLNPSTALNPCIINPESCIMITDPCIIRPWLCYGFPEDDPGFPDPPFPILDVSNLGLNESLIVTHFGESTIITKLPTENVLNQNAYAMLNRTHLAGNMTG